MKVIFSDMYGTSTGVKLYSRDVDVVGEGAIEEVSDVLHTFLTVATDALSEDISHVAAKRFQSLAKTAGFQTKVTNTNYEGIVIWLIWRVDQSKEAFQTIRWTWITKQWLPREWEARLRIVQLEVSDQIL